jgi:hypothetical protein
MGTQTDGYVQVASDGGGKKVDASEIIRSDSTTVERQRVAVGSDEDPGTLLKLTPSGEASVVVDFDPVIIQLKRIALLLEILTGHPVGERDVS